ncbi:MAG: hypothetical protein IJZ64_04250 [Ruminococcus sp.]|nr:hypothetical protein [Ruminococcus sp.]
MKSYIEVKEQNIILTGVTHSPWGKHKFIVYLDENNSERNRINVRVSTDYYEVKKGVYECCIYYDRGLCNTIDEFRNITIGEIERQAYGSYMDGAR